MKNKITDQAQANYDRGVLTLDLPRAKQPMLWRQEIKNISNVAFWVAQDAGEHTLMLRLANGTEQTIARFTDEATAEQSLAAVREIFINVKSQGSVWRRLIKIVIWIVILWVVITFVTQFFAVMSVMKKGIPAPAAVTETAPQPAPGSQTPLPELPPTSPPEH